MPIPTAAVTHTIAAVVIPTTRLFSRKMIPAPMKPMPVTMLAAIRPASELILMERIVNSVDPIAIRMSVRNPADLLRYSRSAPMIPPRTKEMRSL
ncbi:hypothetical protein D3C87_1886920 [compost metagenome]